MPAINKLPYANPKSFDLLFKLLRVDEVVSLYTALMTEEKSILVVSQSKYDLVLIVDALISLMYPFKWELNCLPFLT